jgi:5-methylcytosine-specific restriction endonuclease McrA
MVKSNLSIRHAKKSVRVPLTNYGRSQCADAVWSKAIPITGKNPSLYRMDVMGKLIKRNKLNAIGCKYSWNIDHIIPRTRGGSDDITNLQPLNRADNIRFSNKLTTKKPNYSHRSHHDALLSKHGIHNISSKPILCVGQTVYVRQSPIGKFWAFAKINSINIDTDTVNVHWIDAGYSQIILYDSLLFDTNYVM